MAGLRAARCLVAFRHALCYMPPKTHACTTLPTSPPCTHTHTTFHPILIVHTNLVDDSLLLVGGELLCHGFMVWWCGGGEEERRRAAACALCLWWIYGMMEL